MPGHDGAATLLLKLVRDNDHRVEDVVEDVDKPPVRWPRELVAGGHGTEFVDGRHEHIEVLQRLAALQPASSSRRDPALDVTAFIWLVKCRQDVDDTGVLDRRKHELASLHGVLHTTWLLFCNQHRARRRAGPFHVLCPAHVVAQPQQVDGHTRGGEQFVGVNAMEALLKRGNSFHHHLWNPTRPVSVIQLNGIPVL